MAVCRRSDGSSARRRSPAVEAALLRLVDAIEERGGARRIRAYLASQLRRLGHGERVPKRWR